MRSRFQPLCVVMVLLLSAGCSKPPLPGPIPYPVHGKVTYQGRPIQGFRVTFFPVKQLGKVQFAPSAVTDDNGEFHLRSYHPDDGAPQGEYLVTFTWPRHLNTIDEPDAGPEVDQFKDVTATHKHRSSRSQCAKAITPSTRLCSNDSY